MSVLSKLKAVVLKIVSPVATKVWWPVWSNLRWSSERTKDVALKSADRVNSLASIKTEANKVYSKFKWVADPANELWDSICPPAYNYQRYLNGTLKDDCDGFHCTMFHILYKSGYTNTYLLAVIGEKGSHCVLLFKFGSQWYVNDYTSVYGGYATAQKAIDAYNSTYSKVYSAGKVLSNATLVYNYSSKRYEAKTAK